MPPHMTPDLRKFLLKCWDFAGTETFTTPVAKEAHALQGWEEFATIKHLSIR